VEAVGVAELVIAGRAARAAVLDRRRDPAEVAIEPVDPASANPQPGAAVDPGTPGTELGHRVGTAALVELLCQDAELLDDQQPPGVIVDAEVDVRVLVGIGAGTRPAERDGDHAIHLGETCRDARRQLPRHARLIAATTSD